ncbi:glycosyltransferase [Streptomyces celluloflavus]|uniref:glycosyltransferase n=1 Tax=Streptomyces celluloflavus TaxID=58344 RepID=UPI003461658C|nr:glycosyltransferase [Streptomyces celluloflavus]
MRSPARNRVRQLATAAIAAHLLWEALTLRRARNTARTALAVPPPAPGRDGTDEPPVLHVLVPGLGEQLYVARTVAAFAAVRDAYPQAYIWFVTTARELAPSGGETTRAVLERQLQRMDARRIAVVEDPRPQGNKASQLNWAVEYIDQKFGGDEKSWIGVFDFDSQPPPQTATWVAATAQASSAEAIQVVPIGTTTLAGPPKRAASRAVVYAEALHQAARSLGVERWKLDRASDRRRMPQYLVGAGMFVRRDALRSVGGFPFVDDVPLGYRLFLEGARFTTVPVLNRVDLPDTVTAHLGSLKLIARGITSWPSALAATRRRPGVRQRDRLRLTALGVADTAEITIYPWLAAGLTPSLLRGPWPGRLLAVAWWAFPLAQTAVMRRVLAGELDEGSWSVPAGAVAAASVGRRFWRTAGTWRLAGDTLRSRLRGKTVTFTKSTRTTVTTGAPR